MEKSVERKISADSKLALYELLQKDVLTDVTIITRDMRFKAHRIILATHCGYFRALFTSKIGTEKIVNLIEVRGSTMDLLLDMMYRRELDLNESNVGEVFIVADFLAFDNAVQTCTQFLISKMNPTNCISLYLFSKLYSVPLLMEKTWMFILRHFLEVLEYKKEFLELDCSTLSAILKADFLNVSNEERAWEAALTWVEHDNSRSRHIGELLKSVRLSLLLPSFLQKIKNNPLVTNTVECRTTLVEAQRILFGLDIIQEECFEGVPKEINKHRFPHHILFAVGGWSGGSPTNCLEAYDLRADRWASIVESDPLGPRAYHSTAVVGDMIYIIGGYNGYDYYNSCRAFNVVSRTWKDISPMNKNRCYVSVAVCGDYIYAMGGYNGQRRQNSAERYNIKQNQWTMIADMQCARSDASATCINGIPPIGWQETTLIYKVIGKIFIVGGFNGHECLNSVEFYDAKRNQWKFITPMSERRSGVSCIGFNNTLYVLGGFNGASRMSSVEKYDHHTRSWLNVPAMLRARSNFAVATIEDTLYVIGGFNGTSTTAEVESYSLETNKWYQMQPMSICRSALSACVVSDFSTIAEYVTDIRLKVIPPEENESEVGQAEETLSLSAIVRRHLSQLGRGSQSI